MLPQTLQPVTYIGMSADPSAPERRRSPGPASRATPRAPGRCSMRGWGRWGTQAPREWLWWQGQLLCPRLGQPRGAQALFELSLERCQEGSDTARSIRDMGSWPWGHELSWTLGALEKGHLLAGDCEG